MSSVNVKWVGCHANNFATGRVRGGKEHRPVAIVIHLMDGSLIGTDSWFKNPAASVSAHYGVGRDGSVHQYVSEEDVAFHCGSIHQPCCQMIQAGVNPNWIFLGIEHEGRPSDTWTDAQYAASAALIRAMCDRWDIPLDRDHLIRHSTINSVHGGCPGPQCDIDRLVAEAQVCCGGGIYMQGVQISI